MKIIISPAKKMKIDNDTPFLSSTPIFLNEAKTLLNYFKTLSYEEMKSIWQCNDKIAKLNYDRFLNMDLGKNTSPALFSYKGIQYDYMNPNAFTEDELLYLNSNLRILSAFYGILKPFDNIVPYRLEMQSKIGINPSSSLYDFWGEKIAKSLFNETDCVINLASKEYSKTISKYLTNDVKFITCIFGEEKDGKVIEKGTLAKMARGEMVRFFAEKNIKNLADIRYFNRQNYIFSEKYSNETTFTYIKKDL